MDFRVLELDAAEGSLGRYKARIKWFEKDKKAHPKLRHRAFWLLHNCVAHPLLGLFPDSYAFAFHSLTSDWLNHKTPFDEREVLVGFEYKRITQESIYLDWDKPNIKDSRAWRIHNCVAHMLIGLFPHEKTFKYHDKTAVEMDVDGWV